MLDMCLIIKQRDHKFFLKRVVNVITLYAGEDRKSEMCLQGKDTAVGLCKHHYVFIEHVEMQMISHGKIFYLHREPVGF